METCGDHLWRGALSKLFCYAIAENAIFTDIIQRPVASQIRYVHGLRALLFKEQVELNTASVLWHSSSHGALVMTSVDLRVCDMDII